MFYLDVNPWPHSMLRSIVTSVGSSVTYLHQSSSRTLWSICQLMLASVNTWPDPCTHYHKLNQRIDIQRLKNPITSTQQERGLKTTSSRWLHQKLNVPSNSLHRLRVGLAPFKVSSSILKPPPPPHSH